MRRRPLIVRILLLLAGGAIVNLAVAITAFVLIARPGVPFGFGPVGSAQPDAHAIELWQTHAVDGWPEAPLAGAFTQAMGHDEQLWYYRGFGNIEYSLTATPAELREIFQGIGTYQVERVTCGIPLRTLQWDSWSGMPTAPAGVYVPNSGHDGFALGKSTIPRRLLWPGFAINTVFYGGMLWLLFAAPFALRTRIRINRGLCPKCAYNLRNRPGDSTLCPECGASVRCGDALASR